MAPYGGIRFRFAPPILRVCRKAPAERHRREPSQPPGCGNVHTPSDRQPGTELSLPPVVDSRLSRRDAAGRRASPASWMGAGELCIEIICGAERTPFAQRRTSKIRLKAVSAARRKRVKPALRTTSPRRFSPAWAPRTRLPPSEMAWAQQMVVEAA
jgi:hypothetical protein